LNIEDKKRYVLAQTEKMNEREEKKRKEKKRKEKKTI
jgi:hypothetical protein